MIGAGGFTFGRGRPDDAAEIVFVDVDARLAGVADVFLAPAPRRGRYAAMDGRAYLLRHEEAFDAIVLDAFADRTATHAHLLTREFFALARSRLAACGGRDAVPEPYRRAGARPAVHAGGPHAALGVRGVPDARAGGGISMAQSGVRVRPDRVGWGRDGVLGRERARGHRRRAGGALTAAGAAAAAIRTQPQWALP